MAPRLEELVSMALNLEQEKDLVEAFTAIVNFALTEFRSQIRQDLRRMREEQAEQINGLKAHIDQSCQAKRRVRVKVQR